MKALDKDGLDYVVDKIYDLVNSGGSADYIVEEGQSGIWTYRKWASGIAECWGTASHSGTWAQWGSLYALPFDAVLFPFTFYSLTKVYYTPNIRDTGSNSCWAGVYNGMSNEEKLRGCKPALVRPTAGDTSTYYCHIYATGLWKEFTPSVMKSATLDTYYPVGSIYISANASFDPNVTFGGTWELMSDSFLVGAGNTYTLGDTGGEATHTLTVDEMPSHKHRLSIGWTSGSKYSVSYTTDKASQWSDAEFTETVGGSQPHNNLPPYKAVNMWLRTA